MPAPTITYLLWAGTALSVAESMAVFMGWASSATIAA